MHTKPAGRTLAALTIAAAIGLAAPLAFSTAAWAADGSTSTPVPFDSFTWAEDRKLPTGGHTVTPTDLTMVIDSAQQDAIAHERWEGVRTDLPAGTPWVDQVDGVAATLNVDAAWASIPGVNVGLWLKSNNPAAPGAPAWPTLEVYNDGGTLVAEVFDTFTGVVEGVTPVTPGPVDLEIALNPFTSEFEYLVNGAVIYSHTATGYESPSAVLFNSYNPGGADDYTVVWSNLRFSTKVAAPTITTATLPDVTGNGDYNASIAATSDTPSSVSPFQFTLTTGTLPPGLALDPATGEISGTTTTAGTYAFTVSVTNGSGLLNTAALQITVPAGLELAATGVDRTVLLAGGVGGTVLTALGLSFIAVRRKFA